MLHYTTFTINAIYEHPYLIWDDTLEAVLIDPGFDSLRAFDQVERCVSRRGLRPVRCLLTHCHLDHYMGAAFVRDRWGLEIEASQDEIERMPGLAEQFAAFGMEVPEGVSEVTLTPFREEPGRLIRYGERTLRILPTPGHSYGGVSFYDEEAGALFAGDTLFRGSYGRTDLWGGDEEAIRHSIREVLLRLPDETDVYPGHGPFTTIGDEKRTFAHIL